MFENFKIKEVQIAFFLSFLLKCSFLIFIYSNNFTELYSDQGMYWKLTERIFSDGKLFGEYFGATRAPIYILFLGFLKKIFNNLYFVILIQILLSFYILYLIFLISRFFGENIAKISILLSSVNLNLINGSVFILTESIFLIFFLLFVYFLFKVENAEENKIYKYLIYSSIFLGLSTLTRPLAFYFFPVILTLFFLTELKNKFQKILIFCLTFAFVISPWCIRNYHYFGKYKLTNSYGQLAGYYLPYIKSNVEKISTKEAREKIYSELNLIIENKKPKNPFISSDLEKKYFFDEIKDYPKIYFIETWLEGNMKFIFSPSAVDTFYLLNIKKSNFSQLDEQNFFNKTIAYLFKNENKIYSLILVISIIFIIILRGMSLYSLLILKKKDLYKIIIVIFLIIINLTLTGPVGSARYRIIVEPFFIIFSSITINYFFYKYLDKFK